METNALGVIWSLVYVSVILSGVSLMQKKWHLKEENSRKLIHILLGNWVFIAMYYFTSPIAAAIVPMLAIIMNYLSVEKGLIKAMERSENKTFGTVWYAVSLLLLISSALYLDKPYLALGGILSMAYGDGLAAVVGTKWGKIKLPAKFGDKTLEGSVTVFSVVAVITGFLAYIYLPVPFILVGVAAGFCGMLLELFTTRGYDNLSLPIGIAVLLYLFSFPLLTGMIVNSVLTVFILFVAWLVDALTARSCLTAYLVGTVLYVFGGWTVYSAMILFAGLGSGLSKLGIEQKVAATQLHERKGTRGSVQVIANALPAVLFVLIACLTQNDAFKLAALVSFAAASADTFSSEVGMLSSKPPISILTLKPLQTGLSGGISVLGLLSGIVGSGIIALLALGQYSVQIFLMVWLFGFIGTVIDSVFGSTLQAKYKSASGITERKTQNGQLLEQVSGLGFITNDVINFVTVMVTGLLFVLFV